MSRSPQLRLEDIAEACEQVEAYVRGYDASRFASDNRTRDAGIRQFEIIGEAVKLLPESLRERELQIPWRQIAGLATLPAMNSRATRRFWRRDPGGR